MLDRAAECVFNRRIIALDKVVVDETDGQGRFAWTSINRNISESPRRKGAKKLFEKDSPTDRLPTMAILRCLGGAGMLGYIFKFSN